MFLRLTALILLTLSCSASWAAPTLWSCVSDTAPDKLMLSIDAPTVIVFNDKGIQQFTTKLTNTKKTETIELWYSDTQDDVRVAFGRTLDDVPAERTWFFSLYHVTADLTVIWVCV